MVAISGTAGNDSLVGGSGADVLSGLGGSDSLMGRAGNDRLDGGTGNDVLNGESGDDLMIGGAGDDTYHVDSIGDSINEASAAGADRVFASISYSLDGQSLEQLVLTGSAAINGTGNKSANRITGNAAANVLNGGLGTDSMAGLGGNDIYVVDNVGDVVVEASGGGIDTVQSSVSFALAANVERLTLAGTAAINGTGNSLANTLTGNSAGNVLDGGAGADVMKGGAGNDSYHVDNGGDRVLESSGGGTDTVFSSISFTLGSYVERLTLTGTAAVNAVGNNLANSLAGNSAGNVLNGGTGADAMSGGGGDDTYVVDNVGDRVVEAAAGGTDTVQSSVGFSLGANVEKLVLTGSAAINGLGNGLANSLTGNAAANRLDGGAGADLLTGLAGDDLYFVDDAGDRAIEAVGGGTDTVNSSVSFSLAGQQLENLQLIGTAAVNATGNSLANALTGNAAANALDGAGADDLLDGGAGADVLTGGAGADRFAFTTALSAANIDRISDFAVAEDRIVLGGAAGQPFAALATGALGTGAFRTGTAAADTDDRLIYNKANGALLYDSDGAGGAAAVQFATLGANLALGAANFTVTGAANRLPTISSPTTARTPEGAATSTIVYQALAQDPDGDRLAFTLGGADASRFTIDQSGAVRFVSPPDFETKASYSFAVGAADSTGTVVSRTVTLSVTDVAEGLRVVPETTSFNDGIDSAQRIDRDLLKVFGDPDLPDPTLPSLRIEGSLSATTDKDFFVVLLDEGELLMLDVDGTPTLDSFVRVLGPGGQEVAFNDDLGSFDAGSTAHPGVSHNQDSFLRFRAPTPGEYRFSIEAFSDENGPTTSGPYQINVSIGPPASQDEIDQENVESLLSGEKWSILDLTYGFPSSESDYGPGEGTAEIDAGMEGLNAQQQSAVRTILASIAKLTNLTFSESSGNPGGAQMRYALSNEPETAHAYYPGGGEGGDSWYNRIEYTDPVIGNYEWSTFLHETGHALGLKHGHESPALSHDRDSMEYTIMTYRSYAGAPVGEDSGFTNETWGFAQTLMMYDIAALQRLYGADFTTNSGNTVYSWSPTTGAFMIDGVTQWAPGTNRIFMTVWDGGGTDTYDFSNYPTHVRIDLRPGEWTITSEVQRANLGDFHKAYGNVANALLHNNNPASLIENAIGGAEGDEVTANQAANRLTGGGGIDWFLFNALADSPAGRADTITDFVSGSGEQIILERIDANPATPLNDSFSFIGAGAFSAKAGELRFEARADGLHILGDVDGNAVADLEIILTNQTTILFHDFVL